MLFSKKKRETEENESDVTDGLIVTDNQSDVNSNKKSKKLKFKIIFTICTITILALIILYLSIFTTIFLSPKQKVMLALSKTFGNESIIAAISDNQKNVNPADSIGAGFLKLQSVYDLSNKIKSGDYMISTNLSVDDLDFPDNNMNFLKGLGVAYDYICSNENNYHYTKGKLRYNIMKLFEYETFEDEESFSFTSKDFLKKGHVYIDKDTTTNDILGSSFFNDYIEKNKSDEENIEEASTILSSFAMLLKNGGNNLGSILRNGDNIIAPVTDLYNSITVKATGDKETYTVFGNDEKCSEYLISIDPENFADFINDMQPYLQQYLENEGATFCKNLADSNLLIFNKVNYSYDEIPELSEAICQYFSDYFEDYENDIEFIVFLDKKCRLIALYSENEFEIRNDIITLELSLVFSGNPKGSGINSQSYLCDNYQFNAGFRNSKHSISIDGESNGKSTKTSREDDLYMDVYIDKKLVLTNETDFYFDSKNNVLELTTKFDDKKNDTKYSFQLNTNMELKKDVLSMEFEKISFSISGKDDYQITLEGEYELSVYEDELPQPKPPKYEILKMSSSELQEFLELVIANAKKSSLFSIFF